VAATIVPGARWDTGERLGYLTTSVELALRHPQLGGPLRAWLSERLRS
jgi:UTP-glucose-1-phosphate uridylyltransferase